MKLKLHEKQVKFIASTKPTTIFLGGVRSGKTYAGVVKGIILAGEYPNSVGCVIAPTYTMLRDVALVEYEDVLNKLGIKYVLHKSEMKISLSQWGSVIYFRSADNPARLYGLTLDWVHIDEGATMGRKVYNIARDRLVSKTPNVSEYIGKLFITTTPNGFNWVYDIVMSDDSNVEIIKVYTIENPLINPEIIEYAKRTMDTRYFRQQYMASFENWAGIVYDEFDPDIHAAREIEYKPDLPTYIAMDFGWTDPAVALWYQYDRASGTWYLLKEFVKSHIRGETLAKVIRGDAISLPSGEFRAPVSIDGIEAIVSGLEIKQRRQEADGRSMRDILASYGIPTSKFVIKKHSIFESIMSVRAKIRSAEGEVKLYADKHCKKYIRDKQNWHYVERDGEIQGEIPDTSVENHRFSHTNDAERYLIDTITPLRKGTIWTGV